MSKIYYIYAAFSISFRFITIFMVKCYHTGEATKINGTPEVLAEMADRYRNGDGTLRGRNGDAFQLLNRGAFRGVETENDADFLIAF